MMSTPASGEVMLCGWTSVLSIRSVTGLPTLTANSVFVTASCRFPSDPSFHVGIILRSTTGTADVDGLRECEFAAAPVFEEIADLALLFTSAIADIASDAKIPAAASTQARKLVLPSARPPNGCP